MATPLRAAVAVLALGLASPAARAEGPEPDAQTKQTMQEWTAADQACRTTLRQEACQRRADTWNALFQRGWRRDASGQWFNHKDPMSPAPSYVRP
jgi:hypothetical protein